MITTLKVQVPKGKIIQIMGDTAVLDEYQLGNDEIAVVTIEIKKVPGEKSGEGE